MDRPQSSRDQQSFKSLNDILACSRQQQQQQNSSTPRSSINNMLPEMKEFDSFGKSPRLNLSRAVKLDSTLNFNQIQSGKSKLGEASVSPASLKRLDGIKKEELDSKSPKNRKQFGDNKNLKSRHGESKFDTLNDLEHGEIVGLIKRIEKNKHFNFDGDEKLSQRFNTIHDFNLIQLPEDFKLEHGKINLYRSGNIEIISGDEQPVRFLMKRGTSARGNLVTDLVITTDNQVYLDKMNVCVPTTLENYTKN